jgi:hypothetical protein
MDPTTARIIQIAATAFAEKLAEEISSEIFRGINDRLDQIKSQLQVINRKLDYLIALVENFPAIVRNELRLNEVDLAYIYLDQALLLARSSNHKSTSLPAVVNDIEVRQILMRLGSILEWENRPEHMMLIPYYCQVVRLITGFRVDSVIRENLSHFSGALHRRADQLTADLGGFFQDAERRLNVTIEVNQNLMANRRLFAEGYAFSPDPPFLSFSPRANPFPVFGDGIGPVSGYHEFWHEQNIERQALLGLRQVIAPARNELLAIIPICNLIDHYIAEIVGQTPDDETINNLPRFSKLSAISGI